MARKRRNTINQPSANPTNKLTAATIGTAAVSVFGLLTRNLAPEWYDPDTFLSLMPVAAFAAGWVFKDNPNIVVVTADSVDAEPERVSG